MIDLKSGQEIKRLLAGRGASYLALSPDGKSIYCTHIYPNPGAFRSQPNSEITVIDTERQVVVERKPLRNVAGVFHVAMSADGRLGVAAQLRPKNLIPLAHVEHGWVFGDSLTLFGDDVGGTVQVPIDELDRYYALPWGVAIAPDKSKIFLTTAGSQSVTVIDVATPAENRACAPPAVRQRSLGLGELRDGKNSRRPQSARRSALTRRQASLRRQPPRRQYLRHRYNLR